MKPTKDDHAVVDLLDVLLEEGAVLQADVLITVADVPLVGVNLRAAIAGMATMREYGFFEDWDGTVRARGGEGKNVESDEHPEAREKVDRAGLDRSNERASRERRRGPTADER